MTGSLATIRGLELDWVHDAEYASSGPSRYGSYLASRRAKILEDVEELGSASWALGAFGIATPPVLSPGLVRLAHPKVVACTLGLGDERDVVARVEIGSAPETTTLRPFHLLGWQRSPSDRLEEPSHYDSEGRRRPTLLTASTLTGPIELGRVSEHVPRGAGDLLVDELLAGARPTLEDLVDQVNELAAPVLELLRSPA